MQTDRQTYKQLQTDRQTYKQLPKLMPTHNILAREQVYWQQEAYFEFVWETMTGNFCWSLLSEK